MGLRRSLLPMACMAALLMVPGACSDHTPPSSPTATELAFPIPPGLLAADDTRDLIVISVDTLRADRLPFYGASRDTGGDPTQRWSPSWMAAHGTLFEQVWAPAGSTRPSFGTLWTGLPPIEHGAIGNKSPVTAPTRAMALEQLGWRGYGLIANYVLRPESGLGRGFRLYEVLAGKRERQIPEQATTVTKGAIAKSQRLFLWAHLMAPHQPYTPPTELAARYTEATGPEATTPYLHEVHVHPERFPEAERERLRALYDAEVRHAAEMVTTLLSGLDAQYQAAARGSLLDNAVVVFVADHGEDLGDHENYFNHAKSLYAGVTRVPLLILGKGWEAGRREATPIGLAQVLDLVLDGDSEARKVHVSAWHRRFYAIRDARWTLVHNPSGDLHGPDEPPREGNFRYPEVALYDRQSDPLEHRDVAAQHPELTRRLLDQLADWYAARRLAEFSASDALDAADAAILEQLGYAGDQVEAQDHGATPPWRGDRWQPQADAEGPR